MEKLTREETATPEVAAANLDELRQLFPEAFAEGHVDFDVLKQALGEYADDREERYNFTWHGKSRARQIAQMPSSGTLLPCPQESVRWGTTHNLFVEGDNLEVLKLLRKSYRGKLKVIYIDPPYNTGKEFIYPDRWRDNVGSYLHFTGQVDDGGHKLSANAETSGRYHTNWLNMMYPRLQLARNLLGDDGLLCVSISDIELANLRSVLDELFGEENYINTAHVLSKVAAGASGGGEDKRLKKNIEYVLIYAKHLESFNTLAHLYTHRPLMDVIGEMRHSGQSWKYTSVLLGAEDRTHYATIEDGDGKPIEIYKRTGVKRTTIARLCREHGLGEGEAYNRYFAQIFSDTNAQTSIRARVIDRVGNLGDDEILEVEYVPRSGRDKNRLVTHTYISHTVRRVIWLSDAAEQGDGQIIKREKLGTLWDHFDYNNVGKEGGVPFPDGKKPIDLLRTCIRLYDGDGDGGIFMDFFAGSGSFAHACMEENASDGGSRRFIAVQLPEPIDPSNKKYASAVRFYKDNGIPLNVASICKARLRRVIAEMEERSAQGDLGFKVFELSSSNIKLWDATFDTVELDLIDAIDNIKPDRTEDDILHELLLKYGLDLCVPTEVRTVEGRDITLVDGGALIVCLADSISPGVASGIASLKDELRPRKAMRVVFRDSSFADDVAKTNAAQILRQAGIDDVKSF